MDFSINSNLNKSEKIELPSGDNMETILKSVQQTNKTSAINKETEDILLEVDLSEHISENKSNESVNAKRNKSNKFFTANNPPVAICNNDSITIKTDEHTYKTAPSYTYQTTPPGITAEEAANGVVKKEREDYVKGNSIPAPDSHSDIYTYDDGSQLINYYDDGKTLSGQEEITYSAGCDPENPKNGDTKTIVERTYNDDGSYYEVTSTYEYSESFNSWYQKAVYEMDKHKAFDAEGNEVPHGSKEYWDIVGGDISRYYP